MQNAIFGNSLQKICKNLQTRPNSLTKILCHGIKASSRANVCIMWTTPAREAVETQDADTETYFKL